MNVIPGDLQALYDYEIEDSEDRIALVLRIPPVFNVKSLSVDYDAENYRPGQSSGSYIGAEKAKSIS